MDRTFLVRFGEFQRLVLVEKEQSIKDVVAKSFDIDQTDSIFLQVFDKEWEEWIDITTENDVKDRSKLKCLLQSNLQPSGDVCQAQANADSPIQVNDKPVSLRSKGPWPSEFLIPKETFSKTLKLNLENKQYLPWKLKTELMDRLADAILDYTAYPNTKQKRQVAQALVHEYPHLKECIGSGTDAWEEALRNKMKNIRRLIGTKEVSINKRKNNLTHAGSSPKVKRPKKGEVNWQPDLPNSEDESSIQRHITFLKKESSKKFKDMDAIKKAMDITYPIRRQAINSDLPVAQLKDQHPCMFLEAEVFNEFYRLMNIDINKTFMKSFPQYADKVVRLAQQKKKQSKAISEVLSDMEANKVNQEKTGILLLPLLLNESQDLFIKRFEVTATKQDITENSTTPFVAVLGDWFEPDMIYIICDGHVLIECKDILLAISLLFSFYYILNIQYPKKCLSVYMFIQQVLADICGGEKAPTKLVTFVQKLKNIE